MFNIVSYNWCIHGGVHENFLSHENFKVPTLKVPIEYNNQHIIFKIN